MSAAVDLLAEVDRVYAIGGDEGLLIDFQVAGPVVRAQLTEPFAPAMYGVHLHSHLCQEDGLLPSAPKLGLRFLFISSALRLADR